MGKFKPEIFFLSENMPKVGIEPATAVKRVNHSATSTWILK